MRFARFAAVAVLMTLTRCGGTRQVQIAVPTPANAQQVIIYDYKFEPRTLTVPVGTTVTWVNHDVAPHTATHRSFGDEPFDTGHMPLNDRYSHRFQKPGTYDYLCMYHQGMTGTIIVK